MKRWIGEALGVVALAAAAELLRGVPFAQTTTFDPMRLALRASFLLALWIVARRLFATRNAAWYAVAIASFLPALEPGRTIAGAYELALASVPAALRDDAGVRVVAWGEPVRVAYLGLLALPLAGVGLVAGRRRVRFALLGLLIAAIAGGLGSLALPFAAGLGFETLETRRDLLRRASIVAPLWLAALIVYYGTLGPPPALLGFATLCAVGFSVLLVWSSRLPQRSRSRMLAGVVALAGIDVATVSFWYWRAL